MKTIKFSIGIKQLVIVFAALLLVFSFTSCAKKVAFLNSNVIPAARGEVAVEKDNNNNYVIKMEIAYLAEPQRLQPPKNAYVVWLLPEDSDTPINLGQIIGTTKLNVKFETVSSSKPRRIFITAENETDIQYPSNIVVLETSKM